MYTVVRSGLYPDDGSVVDWYMRRSIFIQLALRQFSSSFSPIYGGIFHVPFEDDDVFLSFKTGGKFPCR
ncbi:hypothetical protein CROQUDRAFT_655741 [Cronartium quercuum f. sp. fusiforme G11]|uniref:Uncharacterized protein n=1 Tax=Cronartium quercuum f. sp. fusiforme G11 TaxID=708437 RepID=A0A9P6TDG8_9BASI|nr:hypothetical protein CROQUDRAFT_655741 [Cronartium quercuum f. sp. fusiforme G11]